MSQAKDFSANPPAFPNVGAAFGAGGPYANYVLLTTAPQNNARKSIAVENDAGAQIVVVIDDGTAAAGAAPVNASMFSLAGGTSAGLQGGSWWSNTEKGRIQVYGTAGGQVMVREN